jgi:hypothetical protein
MYRMPKGKTAVGKIESCPEVIANTSQARIDPLL